MSGSNLQNVSFYSGLFCSEIKHLFSRPNYQVAESTFLLSAAVFIFHPSLPFPPILFEGVQATIANRKFTTENYFSIIGYTFPFAFTYQATILLFTSNSTKDEKRIRNSENRLIEVFAAVAFDAVGDSADGAKCLC